MLKNLLIIPILSLSLTNNNYDFLSDINYIVDSKIPISNEFNLSMLNSTDNNIIKGEDYVVIGNYTNLDSLSIKKLVKKYEKVIIYSSNSNYHQKYYVNVDDRIIENNFYGNENNTIEDFYNFIKDIDIKISQPKKVFENENPLFSTIYTKSDRLSNKPYGYIDCNHDVLKYRVNDVSSLYIINLNTTFVPGIIAKINDSTGFSDYLLNSGYIHILPKRAYFEIYYDNIRYGAQPYYKDAFPVNQPNMVTISSTFNEGLTLGYSFTNGFSLDNIYAEVEQNTGLNISFGYSKSISLSNPSFSMQHGFENRDEVQWNYQYHVNMEESFHFNSGYILEMSNDGGDLSEGSIAYDIEFKTINKSKYYSLENTYSHTLYTNYDY